MTQIHALNFIVNNIHQLTLSQQVKKRGITQASFKNAHVRLKLFAP